MIQQLAARKITPERFNIEMPVNDIARGLYAYYHNEVTNRGREPEFNDEQKNCIRKTAQWLADPTGKPGLMLQGLYGNGKTTLMKAIIAMVNEMFYSNLYEERVSIKSIEAKDIAQIGIINTDKGREEFKKLCSEPLLAIDDLGEEPAEILKFGMFYTPVKDLLLERYKRQAFTIVTTNLINVPGDEEKQELTKHYGERVVDRFREMMEIIIFKNPSYRKQRN